MSEIQALTLAKVANEISFPGVWPNLKFNVSPEAFRVPILDRPIYFYGIIIALAFLSAAVYVLRRTKTFGLDSDRVMDVILCAVIFGIVGARLYYVTFTWDTYSGNPLSVFYIWEGGIAIFGGIIGGVIAAVFACRWRKVKLLPMLDLASGGLFIGQAIGRWGNFVNAEAYGSVTTLPWGMKIGENASSLVHPTFFYESMWCLLGFLFIAWYTRRRRFDGELWLIYLGWYGLGRFFIERLRTDSLMLGSVRVSQIVALLCVLASVFVLFSTRSKIRRSNDPDYMKLYVDTDEGKAILAGTFYKKKEITETAEERPEAESIEAEQNSETEEKPEGENAD